MKITAYEVRPDEKDYLLAAAQQEQIEITLVQGPMTQDNIDRGSGRHYESWRYNDGRRID